MGRRSIARPELEADQRKFATLLDTELERGQRGTEPRDAIRTRWQASAAAEAFGCSVSSLAKWRNPNAREPPEDRKFIRRILSTLYGDDARYADERRHMLRLWQLARGYIPDEIPQPKPWTLENPETFSDGVNLVILDLDQPVKVNDGPNIIVKGSLEFRSVANHDFDGTPISVGLTEALIAIESPAWQPIPDSVYRSATPRGDFERRERPNVAKLTAKRLGMETLNHEPFPDERLAELAPKNEYGGPFTVTVRAARGSIAIGGLPTTATQDAVLLALFGRDCPKDSEHCIILAEARAIPGLVG